MDGPAVDLDACGVKAIEMRPPVGYDAGVFRAFHEDPVQKSASNAEAVVAGKGSLGRELSVDKADPAEPKPDFGTEVDAEATQCREAIGHQALAARLVDGRLRPIRKNNTEAVPARRQSGGEPRRTAAGDEDVGFYR